MEWQPLERSNDSGINAPAAFVAVRLNVSSARRSWARGEACASCLIDSPNENPSSALRRAWPQVKEGDENNDGLGSVNNSPRDEAS